MLYLDRFVPLAPFIVEPLGRPVVACKHASQETGLTAQSCQTRVAAGSAPEAKLPVKTSASLPKERAPRHSSSRSLFLRRIAISCFVITCHQRSPIMPVYIASIQSSCILCPQTLQDPQMGNLVVGAAEEEAVKAKEAGHEGGLRSRVPKGVDLPPDARYHAKGVVQKPAGRRANQHLSCPLKVLHFCDTLFCGSDDQLQVMSQPGKDNMQISPLLFSPPLYVFVCSTKIRSHRATKLRGRTGDRGWSGRSLRHNVRQPHHAAPSRRSGSPAGPLPPGPSPPRASPPFAPPTSG